MNHRFPDAAAGPVGLGVCQSIVRRVRQTMVPRIPRMLNDLDGALGQHWATQHNYRGWVHSRNGEQAFIFISDEMLRELNNARDLMMDGTFRVTPYTPRFSQL